MLFKVLLAATLAVPAVATVATTAQAEDTLADALNHDDELEDRRGCSSYDFDPTTCNAQFDCRYNSRRQQCEDRGGGGGGGGGNDGGHSCTYWDRDPFGCNQQPNCQYDNRARLCQDDWNPGHRECWEYDNQPRLCDQTPGCAYDRRSARCVDDFGPGPGPGPGRAQTRTIECASGGNRYSSCAVNGEIVSAYLQRQISSANCVQNRTWGFEYDRVWVDYGCRGYFTVTYYPYH